MGQLLRKSQKATLWHPNVVEESMSFMTSAVRVELAEVLLVSQPGIAEVEVPPMSSLPFKLNAFTVGILQTSENPFC